MLALLFATYLWYPADAALTRYDFLTLAAVAIQLGMLAALFVVTAALFWRTAVCFTPWRKRRAMPLLFGWLLVALFIWFAENIGTFTRAWAYPSQGTGWHMVSPGKLGAWYLLMIVSFVLVSMVHRPQPPELASR